MLSTVGNAQVQNDGSPYPHGTGRNTKPPIIEIRTGTTATNDDVGRFKIESKEYGIVRIGEYYWMNRNASNKKATHWHLNGDWGYVWEEVGQNLPTQAQLDKYMENMQLPKDQFQIENMGAWNANEFNENYGAYYYGNSIYGNWINQFVESIETAFNIQTFSGWRLPAIDDFKQLFGMVAPDVISLSTTQIRYQLGPLNKNHPETKTKSWLTNSMAYNMESNNGNKVYWFEGNNNRYGFNLMPNGGRSNKSWMYTPDTRPAWALSPGDFFQLFYSAKFAVKQLKEIGGVPGPNYAASLDISQDYITFNPEKVGTNVKDKVYETWYGVRYCKRLSPDELGYEIYYIPGKDNANLPDYDEPLVYIAWKDANGQIPPAKSKNYKILPEGYFRGFFTQYEIYEKNPKSYNLADYVKMARCVQDQGLMKDLRNWNASMSEAGKDTCDCNTLAPIYLKDHMQLMTDKPFSYGLKSGENFSVRLETTFNKYINIGLFKQEGNSNATFVSKANIGSADKNGIYNCVALDENGMAIKAGTYIIQPFRYGLNGEIIKVERKKEDLHLIDRIPIIVQSFKTPPASTFSIIPDYAELGGSMIMKVSKRTDRDIYRYLLSTDNPEEFTITVPIKENRNFKIGLYTRDGSRVIDDIRMGTNNGTATSFPIKCLIPTEEAQQLNAIYDWEYFEEVTKDLADIEINADMEALHFIAAYYPDNESTIISRKDANPYTDRIPVYFIGEGEGSVIPTNNFRLMSYTTETKSNMEIVYDNSSQLVKVKSPLSMVAEINIYSSDTGTVVKKGLNTSLVDVTGLAPGVYIVKVIDINKQTQSFKFIKR